MFGDIKQRIGKSNMASIAGDSKAVTLQLSRKTVETVTSKRRPVMKQPAAAASSPDVRLGKAPIHARGLSQVKSKSASRSSLPLSSSCMLTPSISAASARAVSGARSQSSSRSISPLSTSSLPTTPISPVVSLQTPSRLLSSESLPIINDEQLLDHSHLQPGAKAELLSYSKTVNMYRENAMKTNDFGIQCDFAIFLVEAAARLELKGDNHQGDAEGRLKIEDQRRAYILEAEKLLKQVATRGYPEAQCYLANMYAAGLLHKAGEPDFEKAFPFFVQAAKHHNPDAAFRAGKCYEDGLGTKRDKAKAAQYYKKAAALNHPGAMYRLGLAELNGELGLHRNVREGHNWLKRSAEAATPLYPHALHELAALHEKGFGDIIFSDHVYAVHLYKKAAMLGYVPSALRLGECYEFGRLGCPVDPLQSVQYYTIAAEQDHPEACFALTAWCLVGSNAFEPCDEQAFAWASRAAAKGLPKAEYALGYFYEVGVGTDKNMEEAMHWYTLAAEHGDQRASQRLQQKPADTQGDACPDKRSSSPVQYLVSKKGALFRKAKKLFTKDKPQTAQLV